MEVLRDSPRPHSCRSVFTQSALNNELADVAKDAPARLQMLDSEGFPSAEETDKLLWVNVVCVMMVTNSVRCVHLFPVNDPFVFR